MASFRSKFEIFSLLTPNKNKYNLFLKQQPWHCARSILYSQKNVNEERYGDGKSVTSSKDPENRESRKRMRFWSLKKTSPTREKSIVNYKMQTSPERKLTLREYLFGQDRKRFCPDHRTYRLTHQRQAQRAEDPRLRDPRYQATDGDVLIYTELIESARELKSTEPQPKSPPTFKTPKAVLLNRMMTEDFDEKNDNCEDKMVTARRYEEMKPPRDPENTIKFRDVKSESINDKPISRRVSKRTSAAEARDSTMRILRQAMMQEEPQGQSRIEKLKSIMNEKMSKSHLRPR